MFKQNGMQKKLKEFVCQKKLGVTLKPGCLLLCLALLSSGCATMQPTVTTPTANAMDKAFKTICYSSSGDTAKTVRQIKVHNETGRRLKLPGFLKKKCT